MHSFLQNGGWERVLRLLVLLTATLLLETLIDMSKQEVFIFDATIQENITMFQNYESNSISDAIEKAGLKELIDEKGMNYRCGENGCYLSGGERQRIGIARGILRESSIIFFDEATAALDIQTGYKIGLHDL